MQHLGAEDELIKVMRDLWVSMSPEERLVVFPVRDRLKGLSPEERLTGLSEEDILRGLNPEQVERLRRLLHQPSQDEGNRKPEE